jgi:hypothetical protein
MNKNEIFINYKLQQATFDSTNKRVAMTDKELATLRAICKTKTFGLVSLIDDIDNIATFNGDYDCKLAQSGNAKEHTLVSIWSRNAVKHVTKKSDYRDYGVRFHVDKLAKLYKNKDFAKLIEDSNVQVYSHRDGLEIRFTFKSLADCLKFIADIDNATKETQSKTQTQKETKSQSKAKEQKSKTQSKTQSKSKAKSKEIKESETKAQ